MYLPSFSRSAETVHMEISSKFLRKIIMIWQIIYGLTNHFIHNKSLVHIWSSFFVSVHFSRLSKNSKIYETEISAKFHSVFDILQIFAVRLFSAIKTIYYGDFCVKMLVNMSDDCVWVENKTPEISWKFLYNYKSLPCVCFLLKKRSITAIFASKY
jgi:hypothetical protein